MIGSRFSLAHTRARALDYMTSEVAIYRPSGALLNQTTGIITTGMEIIVYRGQARIWASGGVQTFSFGESDQGIQTSFASIPWDTDPVPKKHDVLYILETEIDSALAARTFTIFDVETGGQFRATRRLSLTRFEESQYFQDTP